MVKSIGEILKRSREKKKLTIEDVYKIIKIHPKYLRAMENDEYQVFSGKVHSKGFLKVYAEFLNLNVDEVLALWRRDYEKNLEEKVKKEFKVSKDLSQNRFVVTPGTVFIGFVVGLIIFFFAYLFFQYRTYTGDPMLELYYPDDNILLNKDILDITGKTDLDSIVFINNQEITLGPDGSFASSIKLKEGINTISVRSVNKLEKDTEVIRTIIYRPEEKRLQNEENVAGTKIIETGPGGEILDSSVPNQNIEVLQTTPTENLFE